MTSLKSVRLICYEYIVWIAIIPFISVSSYVYDGIFLGAAREKKLGLQ
ncbi:MAG: hypothetical protein CM15mP98_09160 [Paracoccaceae bacterium]|nr:MAG: hypothetical protein CM15mP98_09160 [Paracoccaceae bacterium]